MIYKTFAEVYDELMDKSLYQKWIKFAEKNLKKGKILDLACGSGDFAIKLSNLGYSVDGLDFSEEMLTIAKKKSDEMDLKILWILGDMLDLSQLGAYQNITCFADSFCYLDKKKLLAQAFKEVAKHLTDNGVFMFDVITPYKTDKIYPGYMYNYTDENKAFIWESYAGKKKHSITHDLTFFVFNEEKRGYERFYEKHFERTYSLEIYQKLLFEAGFNKIKVSSNYGKDKIISNTTRWFFVCQK